MVDPGLVVVDKAPGMTSHDVVATVRRRLRDETGEKHRVGHAGTLDPFATGLLLLEILRLELRTAAAAASSRAGVRCSPAVGAAIAPRSLAKTV